MTEERLTDREKERLQERMVDAERAHGNDMQRVQQPAAGVIKTEGR